MMESWTIQSHFGAGVAGHLSKPPAPFAELPPASDPWLGSCSLGSGLRKRGLVVYMGNAPDDWKGTDGRKCRGALIPGHVLWPWVLIPVMPLIGTCWTE